MSTELTYEEFRQQAVILSPGTDTVKAISLPEKTISAANIVCHSKLRLFGTADVQMTLSASSNQLKIQPGASGNALIITAATPATADRTVTLPDPGANVDVAYVYAGDIVKTAETVNAVTTSITAAQLVDGIATITTAGGAVTCTLPTAALIVAAVPGAAVGDVVKCLFVAHSHAANAVTLATASGLTLLSDPLIGPESSRLVYFRLTNVTASSEAVSVY